LSVQQVTSTFYTVHYRWLLQQLNLVFVLCWTYHILVWGHFKIFTYENWIIFNNHVEFKTTEHHHLSLSAQVYPSSRRVVRKPLVILFLPYFLNALCIYSFILVFCLVEKLSLCLPLLTHLQDYYYYLLLWSCKVNPLTFHRKFISADCSCYQSYAVITQPLHPNMKTGMTVTL
jgi:hypothetical protein